ncbi:hypothetical protein JTB14_035714 [Gonioctena quinquepunctata]|nr:hypothetical protein JTB14_035714 [Gonioctena quinquepunctata]
METIKKARSAQRTTFTKIYNAMMDNPDTVELEENLRMLDQKNEGLNELNNDMYDGLLKADCTPEDLDSEIAGVDDYSYKYNKLRIKVESLLRKEAADSVSESNDSNIF